MVCSTALLAAPYYTVLVRGANAGVADVREEALLRIDQVAGGGGGRLLVSMTHVTLALASALGSIYIRWLLHIAAVLCTQKCPKL
jgi:hypothetical protein